MPLVSLQADVVSKCCNGAGYPRVHHYPADTSVLSRNDYSSAPTEATEKAAELRVHLMTKRKVKNKGWAALRAKQPPYRPPKPALGLKFRKGKFRGIDIEAATRVLLDPTPSFYGHKTALFAGLTAWIISPKSRASIIDAVVVQASRSLNQVEQRFASRTQNPHVGGMARSSGRSRDVFERIYVPTGGTGSLLRAYKRAYRLQRERETAETPIRCVVGIIRFFHLQLRQSTDGPTGFKPSLAQAGRQIAELGLVNAPRKARSLKASKAKWSDRSIRGYWARQEQSAAFLYAADQIHLPDGRTLLGAMLSGKLTLVLAQPHLTKWFSLARFVTEEMLSQLPLRKKYDSTKKIVRRFPAVASVEASELTSPQSNLDSRR